MNTYYYKYKKYKSKMKKIGGTSPLTNEDWDAEWCNFYQNTIDGLQLNQVHQLLKNAISFFQYVITHDAETKLVTLIGEHHGVDWNCFIPYPSAIGGVMYTEQNISEYAIDRATKNHRCKILLEINPDSTFEEISRIGSQPIREIAHHYTPEMFNSKVIRFDIRPKYICSKWLYDQDWSAWSVCFTSQWVISRFIQPFYDHRAILLSLIKDDYSTDAYTFLETHYITKITKNFYYLWHYSTTKWNGTHADVFRIRELLKIEWMKICDFHIFKEILKKTTESNEYIIISGEQHRINQTNVLRNLRTLVSVETQENPAIQDRECIHLFNTYIKESSI